MILGFLCWDSKFEFLEVFEDGVVETQLIEVLRNWGNGEGVKVLGLKEEMGGFEKKGWNA